MGAVRVGAVRVGLEYSCGEDSWGRRSRVGGGVASWFWVILDGKATPARTLIGQFGGA